MANISKQSILCVLVLFLVGSVVAYGSSGGISGRTLKPGSTPGCGGCHGTQNTGTTVSLSGSATVAAGGVYPFTVSLTGTAGSNGGIDIAVFRGSLSLSPSSTFLRVLNAELTHTQARPVPTSFQFNYTAPATAGTDTMYATGKGGASSNSWNHGAKYVIQVVTPPGVPTLVAPANGAVGVSTQPTMTWNAVSGATSYRLQVSTNSNFTAIVFDDSSITGTSRQVIPALANGVLYYWRVGATNIAGTTYSGARSFTTSLTDVSSLTILPAAFGLSQNYPNPFNPSTQITFSLPMSAMVSLEVLDITGKPVAVLSQGRFGAGTHTVTWDATGMASGLYFARFRASGPVEGPASTLVRKLMLIR